MDDKENGNKSSCNRRPHLRAVAFAFGAVLAIASIAYAWDHLHVELLKLGSLIGAQTATEHAAAGASVTEMITELSLQSIAFASLVFLGGLALMLAALIAGGKSTAVPAHTVTRESKEGAKDEETTVDAADDDGSFSSAQSIQQRSQLQYEEHQEARE